MASSEEVLDSLESFAETCNANQRLKTMNKDWNRTIHIRALDLGEDYTLKTANGEVAIQAGKAGAPNLDIQSSSEILTQIFYGELSPNEPYNDGSLRIQGPESDILHLDFIIAMLWG